MLGIDPHAPTAVPSAKSWAPPVVITFAASAGDIEIFKQPSVESKSGFSAAHDRINPSQIQTIK
jgi:hypothetical protein